MRILLVEDDLMLGETLKSALEPQGYTVDWLRDGVQALHAIADQHIDLVILDLGLPKLDGSTQKTKWAKWLAWRGPKWVAICSPLKRHRWWARALFCAQAR